MPRAPPLSSILVEHNDVELARYQSAMPGGEFGETQDAAWFALPIPAGRFNCVLRSTLSPNTADKRIGELLAPYRKRARPYGWVVSPTAAPADLPRRLRKHGLFHLFDLRAMAADMAGPLARPRAPANLTIEKVTDDATLAVWVRTMSEGFADPPEEAAATLAMERALGMGARQPRTHFLGRIDGEPVATSFTFVDGQTAGVYNVATVEAWRGLGIGAALTVAAMQHGREEGYRVATLLSTPAGVSLYRSLGFKDLGRIAIYTHRPRRPRAEPRPRVSARSSRTGRPSKGVRTPRGSARSASRGRRRA